MTTEKPNFEMIAECLHDYANLLGDGEIDGAGRYLPDNIDEQADLIAALSAAPVAVKVRGLKWNVIDDDHWGASGLGLSYEIRRSQITGKVRIRGSRNIHDGFMDFDGTVEEAQAAAQADYERRILSAIEAAPVSAEPQPEPVAWYETKLGEMVAWLLVEKLKKPDDVYYSEEEAIDAIEKAITPDLAAENERLREALERLRDATPYSTNTFSSDGAFAYVHAVVNTALDDQKGGAA